MAHNCLRLAIVGLRPDAEFTTQARVQQLPASRSNSLRILNGWGFSSVYPLTTIH